MVEAVVIGNGTGLMRTPGPARRRAGVSDELLWRQGVIRSSEPRVNKSQIERPIDLFRHNTQQDEVRESGPSLANVSRIQQQLGPS